MAHCLFETANGSECGENKLTQWTTSIGVCRHDPRFKLHFNLRLLSNRSRIPISGFDVDNLNSVAR